MVSPTRGTAPSGPELRSTLVLFSVCPLYPDDGVLGLNHPPARLETRLPGMPPAEEDTAAPVCPCPLPPQMLSPRGTAGPEPWPEARKSRAVSLGILCTNVGHWMPAAWQPCARGSTFWCGDPHKEEQIGHAHPCQVLLSAGVMRNRAGAGEGRRGRGTGNAGCPGRRPAGNSGGEHPRQNRGQVCGL